MRETRDLDDMIDAAEKRHRKRRRRTARIYDTLDRVFFPLILLTVVLGMIKFVQLIWPHFIS